MFGLFGSKQNKKLDDIVMRVGSALHKQIKSAADEVNLSNRKAIFKRMDDSFTAGYLFGYTQASLAELSLEEKQTDEFMMKVFDGIFPDHGYSFVMSRIEQLNNADDMGLNVKIEKIATDFGAGIELGENDARVNSGGLEVATSLSLYITTGKIRPTGKLARNGRSLD